MLDLEREVRPFEPPPPFRDLLGGSPPPPPPHPRGYAPLAGAGCGCTQGAPLALFGTWLAAIPVATLSASALASSITFWKALVSLELPSALIVIMLG